MLLELYLDPSLPGAVMKRMHEESAWWNACRGDDHPTEELHVLRMHFAQESWRRLSKPSVGFSSSFRPLMTPACREIAACHRLQCQVARRWMRKMKRISTDMAPNETAGAVEQVAKEIGETAARRFESLLARYAFFSRLWDRKKAMYVYSPLKSCFLPAEVHQGVTRFCSISCWSLALTATAKLLLHAELCVDELYAGDRSGLVDWCGEHVAEDLPFFAADVLFRRSLRQILDRSRAENQQPEK